MQYNAKNEQVHQLTTTLGLDESKLKNMMDIGLTEVTMNQYGRFDELKATVDKAKAKAYFEKIEGASIPPFKVNIRVDRLLQDFILQGGFEIELIDLTSSN